MNESKMIIGFVLLLILALVMAIYPLRRSKVYASFLAIAFAVFTTLAYLIWGAWPELQQHLRDEKQQQRVQALLSQLQSPDDLIQRLKARLQKQSADAQGWYLLGRLYASQQQWQQALQSFKVAHDLNPSDEKITVNYLQSQWQIDHRFSKENKNLINELLIKTPDQIDVLSMLAMDAFAHKQYTAAINYWQRLLSQLDANSAEGQAIQKAIAQAQRRLYDGENK